MFLTKDSKSPDYQLVYFLEGRRTKISTKTSNRKEAEKFLKFFNPGSIIKSEKRQSIKLSSYISEYSKYVGNTHSVSYLETSVVRSFNKLQVF